MADMNPAADADARPVRVVTKPNRQLPRMFQERLVQEAQQVWDANKGPRPDYRGLHLKYEDGLWHAYKGVLDQGAADGIYAYVTMLDETIRVELRASGLHHNLSGNCLHVLYAGEAEFKRGVLGRWNNVSGTYRAAPTLKFQSGFGIAAGFTEERF